VDTACVSQTVSDDAKHTSSSARITYGSARIFAGTYRNAMEMETIRIAVQKTSRAWRERRAWEATGGEGRDAQTTRAVFVARVVAGSGCAILGTAESGSEGRDRTGRGGRASDARPRDAREDAEGSEREREGEGERARAGGRAKKASRRRARRSGR
jgi:hypothetical protein